MPKNYYETLEVDKSATEEQIKKVYRELSLKWHPDKNLNNKEEAEEKFKEIGEAYRILLDSETRKMYDTYGERWKDFLESTNHKLFEDSLEKRELLVQTKAIYSINNEFTLHWRLREEELDSDYHNWRERVRKLKGDELEEFRVQMIDSIRMIAKEKKQNLLKREAVERINDILNRRELEIEELSLGNHNYEQEINNLLPHEIEKINLIEKRIIKDAERIVLRKKEDKKIKEKEAIKHSEYFIDQQEEKEESSLIRAGKKWVEKKVKKTVAHVRYLEDNPNNLQHRKSQTSNIYPPENLAGRRKSVESTQSLGWQQEKNLGAGNLSGLPISSDNLENYWWKEISKIINKIDIFDIDPENIIIRVNEEKVNWYNYYYNLYFNNSNDLRYLENELGISNDVPIRRINELKDLDVEVKKLLGNPLPVDWKEKLNQLKDNMSNNQELDQQSEIISLEENRFDSIHSFSQSYLDSDIELKGNESLQQSKEVIIESITNQQTFYLGKLEKLKGKLKSKSKNPQKAKSKTIQYQSSLEEFLELQNLITSSENDNKQEILNYLSKRQSEIKRFLEEKLFPNELEEIRQIKESIARLKIRATMKNIENRNLGRSLSNSSQARSSVISRRLSEVVNVQQEKEKSLPLLPERNKEESSLQREQEQLQTQIEQPPKGND